MMKWGFAFNALLGGVLVVPALTSQSGEPQDLQRSLDETVRALEVLSGVQARLETPIESTTTSDVGVDDTHTTLPPRGELIPLVRMMRESTEPPAVEPQQADERLAQLRVEVARLQMVHDGLASGAITPTTQPGSLPYQNITTGLNGDSRRDYGLGHERTPTERRATAIEPLGFSADPLRQGQASFRAGKFEDALKVLESLPSDARAAYWRGRCLEKLGRAAQAREQFEACVASKDAGEYAQRARSELEFLEWKRGFAPRDGASK